MPHTVPPPHVLLVTDSYLLFQGFLQLRQGRVIAGVTLASPEDAIQLPADTPGILIVVDASNNANQIAPHQAALLASATGRTRHCVIVDRQLSESELLRYLRDNLNVISMGLAEAELHRFIRMTVEGKVYVDPQFGHLLIRFGALAGHLQGSGSLKITRQQRLILQLLCEGLTAREIANRNGISVKTVEVHAYNLRKRLQARNRVELLQRSIQMGLIRLPGQDQEN